MPALPLILRRSAATATRGLDSLPIQKAADNVARAIALPVRHLWSRASHLFSRQSNGVLPIPNQYAGLNSGPAPGAVAGIVLGSVAGFLLLIWILWIVSSSGTGFIRSTNLVEEDVIVRRRSRSRGTRRSRHTEMASRSPRRERVVRQERIVRESVPPPRAPSRIRETILVDEFSRGPPPERRVDGDDVVEVIEEHDSLDIPAPRRKSRRSSGIGGYR